MRASVRPVAWLAAATLMGCVRTATIHAAPPISVIDGRGKQVTLAALPRRIVSLAPAITEILFALGLRGRIVADTSWCTYPPAARNLPHIGDFRTSVEKVVAQRPDLVVASSSANSQAVEQLERLHIPVFAVDPQDLGQTYDAIRRIGQVTGQAQKAEQVVRHMQNRIAAVRRHVAGERSRPRVFIVVQSQPLMVAGSANFMDDVVTQAGGVNVGRDAGAGYRTYSLERMVVARPDVILAGREDAAILRANRALAVIPAIRRRAVYTVNQDIVSRPGPRLAVGIETVSRLLHSHATGR